MDENYNTYILDDDQPTTCPLCGARTDFRKFVEQKKDIQFHECLNENCNYQFIGEFEA